MPIIAENPVTVDYPEIPFDRELITLVISPTIIDDNTDVGGSVHLRCVPYRKRPDGQIEQREDKAWSYSCGNIFEEAQIDPALAQAMGSMFSVLQAFISAKGV